MIKTKKDFLASLIGAITVASANTVIAQDTNNGSDEFLAIEEIIVTAQRRSQSIQDVANSVEAMTGADLDALSKVGLEDYISSIGGTGFSNTGSGSVKIGMRGISPVGQTDQYAFAQTVSTVGMYLDDVAIQGAGTLPDLNLYDMQRIEVLKGPQGTLYGDGAMGGAIKMILNKPDLYNFEAKGEVSAINTKNADVGHRIRGAVNIPLIEEKLAMRIVASTDEKKGWIDNIATGEDGVNDVESWSLRATTLAQFTEDFSAELMVMHDERDTKGFAQELTSLGDLETNLLEDEFDDVEVDLYALTLKYDLGFAELTSITSQFKKERQARVRTPFSLDELLIPIFYAGTAPAFGFSTNTSETLGSTDEEDTISQEIRLVSNGDNTLDWTLGLFYRDRQRDVCAAYDNSAFEDFNAVLGTGSPYDNFIAFIPGFGLTPVGAVDPFPETTFDCNVKPQSGYDSSTRIAEESFEQIAAYGEINWELNDKVEVTLGLRYFEEEVTFEDSAPGYGLLSALSVPTSENTTKEDDVLFKVGISWAATDDQLYYFNIAEGFRSGGSNLSASSTLEPQRFRSYDSDSLINYELGAKTTWYDGRLTLNGALYYSDWSDIQAQVFVPSTTGNEIGILTPGGDAEVMGIELAATYLVNENLTTGMSFTYQEAEFTDPLADSNIQENSDLPNAPNLTTSIFAQYNHQFDVGELFTRLEYRYVDKQRTRIDPLDETPTAPSTVAYNDESTILPSYQVTNLTVGFRTDSWYITAYAHNLFDERYATAYGHSESFMTAGDNPTLTAVGSPRTMGLTVGTSF
ncbi:TonB-dependent receptor [Maricurvus nonylphenolicus]|uniref:TonB-dependent receptor n=1 Tax=Maricurvus nonylphenolicus TaxID=1008307 RepID=UPI0036F1E96E